jgi:hypothetical protein
MRILLQSNDGRQQPQLAAAALGIPVTLTMSLHVKRSVTHVMISAKQSLALRVRISVRETECFLEAVSGLCTLIMLY